MATLVNIWQKNDQQWPKLVKKVAKESKVAKNGPKQPKMVVYPGAWPIIFLSTWGTTPLSTDPPPQSETNVSYIRDRPPPPVGDGHSWSLDKGGGQGVQGSGGGYMAPLGRLMIIKGLSPPTCFYAFGGRSLRLGQ